MRYRRWADLARLCQKPLPKAEDVTRLAVVAFYTPPDSWSEKKKRSAYGKLKRTKPDGDNVLKSVCDALWGDDDAKLGDMGVARRWARESYTEIMIETV
jgi:Holliday junction resolvase RusA-like endonuclease